MKLNGKKILFVTRETYSYPLFFLAERWKHDNDVAAFFFMPHECMYSKCYFNDTTYYLWQENNYKIYDSRNIAQRFTEILNKKEYDEEELKRIEREYSNYTNLNIQILTTQFLTRNYHWRNHYVYTNYEQQLNWLILNYQNTERVLDDFKPDIILDTDISELGRTAINEVAHARGIPYITICFPRYKLYRIPSYNLLLRKHKGLVEEYHKALDLFDLKEEMEYIHNYQNADGIMMKTFKDDATNATAKYDSDSLFKIFKKIYSSLRYFWNQDITAHNWKLKRSNPVIYPNSVGYMKFVLHYHYYRTKLLKPNKIFENPVEGEKYVYMPLHLIPESTTFTLAPFYINELTIIEAVSKSLPAGWRLYVKEHQAMVGERGIEFYKKVKKIPNVRLVQLNYYRDPKPWIQNSQGVVTINGTTAYEAALLGKKSLVFGEVPFELIESITRVRSLEELPRLLADFHPVDNIRSCAAYIHAVKQVGMPVDFTYLMNEGYDILRNGKQMSEKYREELDKLEEFYLRAYRDYEKYGKE